MTDRERIESIINEVVTEWLCEPWRIARTIAALTDASLEFLAQEAERDCSLQGLALRQRRAAELRAQKRGRESAAPSDPGTARPSGGPKA